MTLLQRVYKDNGDILINDHYSFIQGFTAGISGQYAITPEEYKEFTGKDWGGLVYGKTDAGEFRLYWSLTDCPKSEIVYICNGWRPGVNK